MFRNRASKAGNVSKGSSGKHSWRLSISRRSVDRSFGLHTRLATVLAEDRQDAYDPNAKGIKIWDHVLLLCLSQEAFLLPYFVAFQPEAVGSITTFFLLVLACEGVFAVDLYIQAHTGYYFDGNLIRDKKLTIWRYVRSFQFILDIVAILPYQVLEIAYPRAIAQLLFLKLLRWSRLSHLVSSLDEFYAKHFVVVKLLKVVVSTIYLAHVLGCVRYSFGHDDTHANHWLPQSSIRQHSLHVEYLASVFWSLGIMTGLFEGELPHRSSEFLFTTLVAFCGFSMFITLVATIFVVSKCESGQTEAMEARIHQLVHVLSFHRVPENYQIQAVEYLKRYYTDAESTDREVAKMLCPSIANDVQVELSKSTIARISLFRGCSEQFIVTLTSLLEMIAVPAHTTIFSVGDYGDAMYVVHSGVLVIVVNSVAVREIRKGSCFGELSVFSTMPRTATVLSSTYAILYKLSRFYCERVLEGYPKCAAVIAAHVQNILIQLNNCEKDANNTSPVASNSPISKSELRRVSVAAGFVAGSSALIKALSRKGSGSISYSRKISVPWKKGAVSPIQHTHTLPISKQVGGGQMSVPRSKRERSGQLAVPSSMPDTPTETGTECSLWGTNNDGSHFSTSRAAEGHNARRRTLNPYDHPHEEHVYMREGVWRLLLLPRCIDHHSRLRLWWLVFLLLNLCYCWLMIPIQIVFPLWQRPSWMTQAADTLSNIGLLLDIFFTLNLSFLADLEKITNPKRSAKRYFAGSFVFDLMCALPYEYLYMPSYGLMRLPRLLRVVHLKKHLSEIEYFINLNSRRQLMILGVLLFMMFHIVACIHFGISYIEGFNSNEEEAWISSINLCLRRLNATHLENCTGTIFNEKSDRGQLQAITALEYARSLYYAVGVLASPGKSVEPVSDVQLIAGLVLMLSGFLITGIVVDNVQKRFTASATEQKEFFATSTRIQLFLRRQQAPLTIFYRVKSFLDYWWSAHRGAVISELLADLPRPLRLDLLRSICAPVLQTLALLQGSRLVWRKLEEVFVENAQFILYGQGEIVYRHGDHVTGMFFLLEGEACVVKMGGLPREIPRGIFFGTAALTQKERGEGYTEHVSASRGCILLFVSRDQLQAMEAIFPALKTELLVLEQRLLNHKLANLHTDTQKNLNSQIVFKANYFYKVFVKVKDSCTVVHDPDSFFILAWETWVFIVMTLQWMQVMFQACFSLGDSHRNADVLMVFLELNFVLDMHIRSRMGFYEYGNKVMDLHRIKPAYFKSRVFALDIAALLPLYIINWSVPAYQRWNMLNINKLLRLFKVPRQLYALETRYLKRTTELRLFKLLYYTFMLSHILGCIWFNFASKEAVPNLFGSSLATKTTFGDNRWLPHKHLEHGSYILQYMASLYWSFGLMSASSEPEFPKTTAQCLFSVLTMTTGFFLFAYVIGNFTDIIELTTSEARDFNAKMGAVRQMLDHFRMPDPLQDSIKTFMLFKRYHTITQEHILVNCLPPSLLTDIRLVYLKPMIEKVEFLRGMEGSITRMLVSQFTQVLVSRGEFVCKFGEDSSDMFFVFTGNLNVFLPARVASRAKTNFRAVVEGLSGKNDKEAATPIGTSQTKSEFIPAVSTTSVLIHDQLKKVNEISAGSYFGENGLFTNAQRNAYIQAQTSCILYRLSRESLETVFGRYPEWKQKVLRIASIHREQSRLAQLSREEQRRKTTTSSGMMLSRADIMNERAERLKEKMYSSGMKPSTSVDITLLRQLRAQIMDQFVVKPFLEVLDALVHGVAAQSNFHLVWLRFMVCCTMYVAVIVPYWLAMDSMERVTTATSIVKAFGLQCEVAFIVDVWFSWHIQESPAAMELYDQNLRSVYKKERMLLDIIAAIPFYGFLSVFHCSPWVNLLRCVKILNVMSYLEEFNRRNLSNSVSRFWHVWMMYLLVIYWATCTYLAVAMNVGFGMEWEGWLPSHKLELSDPENPSFAELVLRFLRGLFFATTAFVKKARNLAPDTASLYAFQITLSFTGLITMSFVIGELASLFISHIGLEVDFRKNHIAVELYLARLHMSDRLKQRAYAFMTSLWSSHAGVNYEELLCEMPRAIRSACVLYVSKEPLDWFVMKVITPICWEGEEGVEALTSALAELLQFECYPRDENVVAEGSIVRAMYFVVKGHLKMQSRSLLDRPVGLRDGSYFGERGLLGCCISAYTVRTARACDLLSLSSEAFSQVLHTHSFCRLALTICTDAYSHLKNQHLASCSKNDMEDNWGIALLHSVSTFRAKHESLPTGASCGGNTSSDNDRANADSMPSFAASDFSITPERKAALLQKMLGQVATEACPEESASASKCEELPKRLREMLYALDTSTTCYKAFAPLLHILLATDPLDWDATISSSARSLPMESLSTSVQQTSNVSTEYCQRLMRRSMPTTTWTRPKHKNLFTARHSNPTTATKSFHTSPKRRRMLSRQQLARAWKTQWQYGNQDRRKRCSTSTRTCDV